MPRISTDNYDTVASWNGSQDLFVVEQPDGTKVATPAMVKQFIEAGDFEATGEIEDGHGNNLNTMAETLANKADTSYVNNALNIRCEGGTTTARSEALTVQMDQMRASGKSGVFPMYCSSGNADYPTIGYCSAIGLVTKGTGGVSCIIAVNSMTGEIWTNGNTSQNAGAWRGWRKIN